MESVLAERFPQFPLASVHSQIDEEERSVTMQRFARGEIRVLVATSVVEVGVNVTNATCMVVDHAERFGLAALHQLRGRVGRSSHRSYCFLIYNEELTEDAKERLRVLHTTTDGFEIAEEDLRIRGPGDLQGLRQSGFLHLRIANLREDMGLMTIARDQARRIVLEDPGLLNAEHEGLRRAMESLAEQDNGDAD
jgi:ATP-dependent DNA helicase RecG